MASLEELLREMDRAAANLAKLDAAWERAQPHIPTGPSAGSSREYDDLRRHWNVLLRGLPKIDGWTVTENLPDIDAAGRAFLDYAEAGITPFNLQNELEAPGRELDEYRFRLAQARRQAVSERTQELIVLVDSLLDRIMSALPDGSESVDTPDTRQVNEICRELDRLLGDTTERRGRWYDMARHLRFSQPHDWEDITSIGPISVQT